jgi:hypothetical protein
MKTILSGTLVIFLLSQILTSCNSSMNIAKRHYNPGYYVSFKSANKKTEEKKSVSKETTGTVSQELIDQEKTNTETAINTTDGFPLTASINKTQPIAHINHSKLKKNSFKTENIFPIVTEIKKIKQKHSALLSKLKSSPNGGGDPSKDWAVVVGIVLLFFFFPLAMPFFRIGFDSELPTIAKAGWWISFIMCVLILLVLVLLFVGLLGAI